MKPTPQQKAARLLGRRGGRAEPGEATTKVNEMNTSETYNGHPSWRHWNVALWFGNDEGLYRLARSCRTGKELFEACAENGFTKTPDGAKLSERMCAYALRSVKE